MDSHDKIFVLARELAKGNEADQLAASILASAGKVLMSSNTLGIDHVERLAAIVLVASTELRELKDELVSFEIHRGWGDFFLGDEAVKIDSLVAEIMGQGIGENSPCQKLIKVLREDRWQPVVIEMLRPFVAKVAPPILVFKGSKGCECEISCDSNVLNIKIGYTDLTIPIKEFLERLRVS